MSTARVIRTWPPTSQGAFLDAFEHLGTLRGGRPFAAWLYRIAQNRLRMVERRRRLQRFFSLDALPEQAATAVTAPRHADAIAAYEDRDLLAQVMDGLSRPLRDALLLHTLDGFTAPEVAKVLGISLAAAERRLTRAKGQCRERYRALNEDGQHS